MRPHFARLSAALLAVVIGASALRAQESASGTIAGTITDSVRAKPAAGATVLLTRLSPEPSELRTTVTDEKGRFRFDTLVAGRYSVAFATDYLDSLSINMPPREVTLATGRQERVDFATPSGATLRAAACPMLKLSTEQGAVIGDVANADSDQPLGGAKVAVSWTELTVDSALHAVTTPRGGVVAADPSGHYRLCGVPTDTYLTVQVQDSGRAGSPLTLTVGHEGGVVRRDLSLSLASARTLAMLDSTAAAAARHDTVTVPPLTGTATLAGVVHGAAGEPLAMAEVRIRGAAGMARSDSSGQFTLTGQPAGSQLLETRHIGYLLGQAPVELRSGRTSKVSVTLSRIVSLDSIRIVAQRSRYPEFESRRSSRAGGGRFLDESEIDRQHAMQASDLLRMVHGFRVEGSGLDTKVYTTHGNFEMSSMGPCEANIVVNGVEHQDINLVDPVNIGAIEAYAGPADAPVQYDRPCGVIVIWLKRGRPAR
ncbi:MAG TPA: carboxypeptidase-like regulatory domain-containing protein [Gemmatimonadaceae bacterium]